MRRNLCCCLVAASLAIAAVGCARSASTEKAAEATPTEATKTATAHTHDGWWCNEHGVPEEVCGQCNAKLAADYQKKGDWCQQHDRPDSQCFVCHPELEARFAAQHEAKLGTKPPKPTM
jgi:hypothetical protein